MKVGGFNRAERVSKLNRLVEIEGYLRDRGLLATNSEKVYEYAENFPIPEEFAETIRQQEEAAVAAAVKKPGKK